MIRLDPRISQALSEVSDAEAKLARVVTACRMNCAHDLVYHQKGYSSAPLPDQFAGSRFHEMRVCCSCGLTEEGNWGHFKVLTTDAIVPVSSVAPHRLPHSAECTPTQPPEGQPYAHPHREQGQSAGGDA